MIDLFIFSWAAAGAVVGALMGVLSRKLLATSCPDLLAVRLTAPLLTAVLFGALAWRLGWNLDLLPYSYLAAIGVCLAFIDVIERRLPGVLLLPSFVVLGALFAVSAIVHSNGSSFARALAGLAASAAFYVVLGLAAGGGLGAGDVKLGGLLGLALGWASWWAVVAGAFLGWCLGALMWGGLRLSGRLPQGFLLPMGPFLLLGALVAVGANPPT
ncbi:prepilin peptidase [Lentzea sp. NPDC051213]|uniref:prepilin peptidase n=1 Tax=Lentzea sp. NPDC051213 TaxID=3364126 RepID=UPI0037B62417